MKKLKLLIVSLLAVSMVLTFVACTNDPAPTEKTYEGTAKHFIRAESGTESSINVKVKVLDNKVTSIEILDTSAPTVGGDTWIKNFADNKSAYIGALVGKTVTQVNGYVVAFSTDNKEVTIGGNYMKPTTSASTGLSNAILIQAVQNALTKVK